ncbi:MAG TPA: phospholipase D-like domain-containing protein [Salinisphaeraceae bacterium]|nr:phospholipase D-like domain-containing protein [Salinisphaeraceae bacterium]
MADNSAAIDIALPDAACYQRALEGVMGAKFTSGNQIEVLENGCRIFPAMLDAIAAARHSIDFLTFVYWQGNIARRFGAALAERARAGVRVRVLLDGFGAYPMPRAVIEQMEAAGVDVAWFRPPVRWRIWQADNRTHRKVLICDERIGFTGGVGIAEQWEGDARNPNEWRDTHFRIIGAAVDSLRGAFLSNWIEAGHAAFDRIWELPAPASPGEAKIQVVATSAAVQYSDIATLLRLLLSMAQRELRIATAYFVPDEPTVALLRTAAKRGVDVEVLMPGPHTDQRVSQIAGEDVFAPLIEAGVKLFYFQPTMLHTKVLVVDRMVACIGSANFNQRSMAKDDELALCVIHEPTVAQLLDGFERDRERCRRITDGNWKKRGIGQRLLEIASRPIRSQT